VLAASGEEAVIKAICGGHDLFVANGELRISIVNVQKAG